MTIYPEQGRQSIDLVYDGGVEMRLAEWVSGITWLILLGWVVEDRRRRLKPSLRAEAHATRRGILKKSW
jgi:hypothetical protein